MSKPFNNSLTESPAYNTRSKMAAPSTSISTPATSSIAVHAPAAGSTLMPPLFHGTPTEDGLGSPTSNDFLHIANTPMTIK